MQYERLGAEIVDQIRDFSTILQMGKPVTLESAEANYIGEHVADLVTEHSEMRRERDKAIKDARREALRDAEQAMVQLIDGRGLTAVQVMEAQGKIKFAFQRLASEG